LRSIACHVGANTLIGSISISMVRAVRAVRGSSSSLLGRSQVVRQRILIPPSPGSNPGAPANENLLRSITWPIRIRSFHFHSERRFGAHSEQMFPRRSQADVRGVCGLQKARGPSCVLRIVDKSAGSCALTERGLARP
jgi:hypothetical protein